MEKNYGMIIKKHNSISCSCWAGAVTEVRSPFGAESKRLQTNQQMDQQSDLKKDKKYQINVQTHLFNGVMCRKTIKKFSLKHLHFINTFFFDHLYHWCNICL